MTSIMDASEAPQSGTDKEPGPSAFELQGIRKCYGAVTALDGITLRAEEGRVFGLLGPNGSGKSTIVKVLSTLTTPSGGRATVKGLDVVRQPARVRELIGLAGQYAAVDEFQTGYENVYMTARLYGIGRLEARRRTAELLEELGLSEAAGREVSTYSGGMRRRLDLGASLVGRPQVLFLDEPTTGLDPKTRNDCWAMIRKLVTEGTSILLTTQYLEEADELADRIAVIDRGKVVAEGTSDELKTALGGDVIEFGLTSAADAVQAVALTTPFAKNAPSLDTSTQTVTVPVGSGSEDLMRVVQALNDAHIHVRDLALRRPSLDDVFLSLTGAVAADNPLGSAT
jgi:ABC-2 type transport system ATP-binding protein